MKIYCDGVAYEVRPGENLLQTCLELGLDLPYFCWHPALGSVGACRQCAIKQYRDEDDLQGQIVMACMTPTRDGARISVADPDAARFRAQVIEWLMVNHPHDCPVCDEGGECHLQDMTVMAGHTTRRYRFDKRTYRNQYLGPLVHHEMNRCIQCYRCVRFYKDYAGGRDLDVFGAHDHVYFGRAEDGVLQSVFSGNLVEVCPTGVFTDKTLRRHYTRKWDLQMSPSICGHCGLGCNITPGERYGKLRRIVNRYHPQVNGHFLCDRGRFAYEFVNHAQRLREATVRTDDGPTTVGEEDALQAAAQIISEAELVLGVGSPRASLESNFALRTLVGAEHFSTGLPGHETQLAQATIEALLQVPAASVRDVEEADAVLILGEDLVNTAPRLALAVQQSVLQRPFATLAKPKGLPRWQDAAVRDAIQDARGPLFIATPQPTELDAQATRISRRTPAEVASLGTYVTWALQGQESDLAKLSAQERDLAQDIAQALSEAERPVVIAGQSLGQLSIIQAASTVSGALRARGRPARIAYTTPECNTLGVTLLEGRSLEALLEATRSAARVAVIVLENDLSRRLPPPELKALLERGKVLALDCVRTAVTDAAQVALPVASYAESHGTWVSSEGRAQRFFSVMAESPPASWRRLGRWMPRDRDSWETLDQVISALSQAHPRLAGVASAAPQASFRMMGKRIPRQPPRYSGRTAMVADHTVHEPAPAPDQDAPLAYSMEGYRGHPPPAVMPYPWAPRWNSVQALTKFQEEIGGELRGGSPGVRLLEPVHQRPPETPAPPPDSSTETGPWLAVPAHQAFGSDELSSLAPGIAELIPEATAGLNPLDAFALGIQQGDTLELRVNGVTLELPVQEVAGLPRSMVTLPVGRRDLPFLRLPAPVNLKGGS